MTREIFPESKNLKEIIENHGWTLYEGNQPKEDPPTWENLEEKGPAENFEIEKNYIFAPIQENGKTLREAYSETKGLGPSLTILDPNEDRWITLYIPEWFNLKKGKPIFFSRLFFNKEGVGATSPTTRDNSDPDLIGIGYPDLIDTFEKYFRIVSPEEVGLTIPVPMPFHPEDN
jgi:hypothetical protein